MMTPRTLTNTGAERLSFDAPGPGVWMRDEDHWPRPVPPSYTEIYPDAIVPYVKEWTARYGLLMDYFEAAFPHGFGYGRVHPVGEPKKGAGSGPPPKLVFKLLLKVHPELRARRRAAERALDERLWLSDLERWERDAKPAIVAENRGNATVDRAALSGEALLDHVDTCRETLRRFIGVHHRFNGGMIPAGMLMVAVRDWVGDPQAALPLLEGASPVSSGRSAQLDRLAAAIRGDATARRALETDGDPPAVLARLAGAGGEIGTAYDEYAAVVGSRLVGDSIEPGNPTLVEVPELLLRTIRVAVDGGGEATDEDEIADRIAGVRAQVPPGDREEFDRLVDDARRTYAMRDERSVLADVWAAGVFRQALLELGRRLVEHGRIAEPVHLIEATSDEVRALATGDGGPSADELAERARFRAAHADHDAPPVLGGEPAPPPPLEWLPPALRRVNEPIFLMTESFLQQPDEQEEDTVLRGAAASAGTYGGVAKVIVGPEDFDRLEEGDVLVARTTSEAFNVVLPLLGAIVTERGGVLSHAAIVSREAGIPCVVGTSEATRRIPDGARVVVDGDGGEVTFA